jgi:hypothetical protein
MTNDEGSPNEQMTVERDKCFVIRISPLFRHSTFVLRHFGASAPPHFPVFDELVWDFLQETRWPLKDVAITGV